MLAARWLLGVVLLGAGTLVVLREVDSRMRLEEGVTTAIRAESSPCAVKAMAALQRENRWHGVGSPDANVLLLVPRSVQSGELAAEFSSGGARPGPAYVFPVEIRGEHYDLVLCRTASAAPSFRLGGREVRTERRELMGETYYSNNWALVSALSTAPTPTSLPQGPVEAPSCLVIDPSGAQASG